jgi:hypothetical protein
MTDQDARDRLDALLERAVALTELNRTVAAIASSVLACPGAWDARARFLDSLNRLETSSGMSAGEVQQVAAGILALAPEGA